MSISSRGSVVKINKGTGYVAIETEDDGVTLIELRGDYLVDIGDEISWPHASTLGDAIYLNMDSNVYMDVRVRNHGITQHELAMNARF